RRVAHEIRADEVHSNAASGARRVEVPEGDLPPVGGGRREAGERLRQRREGVENGIELGCPAEEAVRGTDLELDEILVEVDDLDVESRIQRRAPMRPWAAGHIMAVRRRFAERGGCTAGARAASIS